MNDPVRASGFSQADQMVSDVKQSSRVLGAIVRLGEEGMSLVTIRQYRDSDAAIVGRLIADTYSKFNLSFASPEERLRFLGPFQYAESTQEAHTAEIARAIRAKMVFVADLDGETVGVLRGREDKLQSLFVREDYHRQGVGGRLVERFEEACRRQGSREIKVQATLYAVPFYLAQGYKRTTGVRHMSSFEGRGLKYQPMKKTL
jgi:GNAT superfamily N-acetyltransferase